MVRDAQTHANEDKQKREEIQARNETDQLIYQTEKNLGELGPKMEPDAKAKLEAALARAKEAIKGTDNTEIVSARDGLNAAWHEVTQKMYAQTGPAGGQPGPEPAQEPTGNSEGSQGAGGGQQGTKAGGSAVDADFEVVE